MSRIELNVDLESMTASELYTVMEKASEILINRKKELTQNISKVGREQQRILHDIETNKFNAAKGFLFAKELRQNRRILRMIKNDLGFFEYLKKHNCNLQEIEYILYRGRNKQFSSNEQLKQQRSYMLFEELGALTQHDVNKYINNITPETEIDSNIIDFPESNALEM